MTGRQKAILTVVVLTNLITAFMASALNLSVVSIGEEFQIGATTLTWIVNSYILTLGALCLPAGSLADATGRRRVFIGGLVLFSVFCFIAVFSISLPMLLFTRVMQAVGAAMIQSSNIPILITAFPTNRRGQMLGLSVSAVYIGLSLGPVLGGFMNQTLGWRSIFILAGTCILVSLFLAIRYVPDDKSANSHATDVPGDILYVTAIFGLLFGLSNWSTYSWSHILVPIGTALLVCFVFRELHTPEPVIDVRIFRHDRAFTFSNLAALLNYSATFAISFTLSIYLQTVRGMPSSLAGLVLICQPVVMALLSPVCGRLSDRAAPYKLASFGMFLSASGLLALSFIGVDSPLWQVIVPLVIIGCGFGFFSSPNTNAVLSCVRPSDYGTANSVLATMRTLGQSTCLVIITLIFASLLGDTLVSEAAPIALVGAIRAVLLTSAVICGIGVVFSLMRRKTDQTNDTVEEDE